MRGSRGAALPVVLLALAMSSALAVGGVYVARQLASAASLGQRASTLGPTAEALLVTAYASWDSVGRADQPVGSTTDLPPLSDAAGVRAIGWVTRTGLDQYWLVAEASLTHKPLLRTRLGLVVSTAHGRPRPIPRRAWAELP